MDSVLKAPPQAQGATGSPLKELLIQHRPNCSHNIHVINTMARTKGAADKKQRKYHGPMSAAAVERQQASRQAATERDTRRREKEQAERDRPAATFFRPCSLSLSTATKYSGW